MIELAIWIVSFIIVVWAIVAIGIPLITLGTIAVISFRKIVSGIVGILAILVAAGLYESNPQLGTALAFTGLALAIYAFTKEQRNQEEIQSKDNSSDQKPVAMAYDDETPEEDTMYADAVEVVAETRKASASLLQRHLKVGYARAARLIEQMEENGLIGPANGVEPREVLIK